jgi:hypothetical protein
LSQCDATTQPPGRRPIGRPAIRGKLVAQGIKAGGPCGAPFADFLRQQSDEYGRIIREADIKAE